MKRLTLEQVIESFRKVHGDRYDYSLVEYKGKDIDVKIICPKHGIFEQRPNSHKRGQHCRKCTNEWSRLTMDQFLSLLREEVREKYKFSNLRRKNGKSYVSVECPIHGRFEQRADGAVAGKICRGCSDIERRKDVDHFTKKSKKIHGNKYDYSLVDYEVCRKKVKIICKKHGPFEQTPASHVSGNGCKMCNDKSSYEDEIEFWLKQYNIKYERRDYSKITPFELDFVLEDYNLAIEVNGVYWHSDLMGKDRTYHLNKTKKCNKAGLRLIHIFENEFVNNKNIVLSKISHILGLNSKKIYARKCNIKEIGKETKTAFLNKYHLQGSSGSSVNLGLYYRNRLVGVMTFCKNRKSLGKSNIDGEWELSRYATVSSFAVVGGAGKLLKYFEKNWSPQKITSYADKRWSAGNLYKTLGFDRLKDSKPNYWYFYKNNKTKLYHRFKFRKSELPRLLDNFDPKLTEWENMINNDWNRIWDCGNMVFEKNF